MTWKPNVTVAAIAELDGRFLLVEEETDDGLRLNQPAGHLEPDESLVEAVAREALEETAYEFHPQHLIGIYCWRSPATGITYLRFAFSGSAGPKYPGRQLDKGIVRALWLTPEEIRASLERHRSPLVLKCVEDYLNGRRIALDALIDC
jgi:8-oxo-dGTP pyrophosphatase MutT (NUDIX family)